MANVKNYGLSGVGANVDLETVGTYQISSNYLFSSSADTQVLMTYAQNGASTGSATVTVTFA